MSTKYGKNVKIGVGEVCNGYIVTSIKYSLVINTEENKDQCGEVIGVRLIQKYPKIDITLIPLDNHDPLDDFEAGEFYSGSFTLISGMWLQNVAYDEVQGVHQVTIEAIDYPFTDYTLIPETCVEGEIDGYIIESIEYGARELNIGDVTDINGIHKTRNIMQSRERLNLSIYPIIGSNPITDFVMGTEETIGNLGTYYIESCSITRSQGVARCSLTLLDLDM